MDIDTKTPSDTSNNRPSQQPSSPFPDEVLEKVLSFIDSHKDRNSISLVHKDWYNAERWTRKKLFIGNCYSVSPEIVARRFPSIKSVTLKGKHRFSDFNMVPREWGANVHPWIVAFAKVYPFLEELRLKRMNVSDESLELLAKSFPGFRALSMWSCDGFTENGLKAIASHCRNLSELDILDCPVEEVGGSWLSYFPGDLTSLQVLNFACLSGEVDFDDLKSLVERCKSLRVLKVNESVTLDQLQQLLLLAPQLVELGTGSFLQELTPRQYDDALSAFDGCRNLRVLSGFWEANPANLRLLYGACENLTFLNLSGVEIQSGEFAKLIARCPNLRKLWVADTIEDIGLESVAEHCHSLEELRVFPTDPYNRHERDGVTELGFLSISRGCPNLVYVLYFCRRMTNAAVITVARNCPNFTHFRLCIMTPFEPDYTTNGPMDEAFAAVVKNCPRVRRLSVSGLLTDRSFESIGQHAKNLETLSVAFAGSSDSAMESVLRGCKKLRKLEIRDCPFGDYALLSGVERYETMRSLWMSTCNVTMEGCKALAREMPRLNVEVINEEGGDGPDTVYVYRSVAGPRKDAPPFVVIP